MTSCIVDTEWRMRILDYFLVICSLSWLRLQWTQNGEWKSLITVWLFAACHDSAYSGRRMESENPWLLFGYLQPVMTSCKVDTEWRMRILDYCLVICSLSWLRVQWTQNGEWESLITVWLFEACHDCVYSGHRMENENPWLLFRYLQPVMTSCTVDTEWTMRILDYCLVICSLSWLRVQWTQNGEWEYLITVWLFAACHDSMYCGHRKENENPWLLCRSVWHGELPLTPQVWVTLLRTGLNIPY
jgi:hypothetical protein